MKTTLAHWTVVWVALAVALSTELHWAPTVLGRGYLLIAAIVVVAYALARYAPLPLVLLVAALTAGSSLPRIIADGGVDPTLMRAFLVGLAVVALLRYAGALNFDVRPAALRTPAGTRTLHKAVDKGDVDYTLRLIGMGVDLDARNGDGETALMVAARRGYADMAELLLEHGADPAIANHHGDTATTLALLNGYTRIAELCRNADLRRAARSATAPQAGFGRRR